MNSTLSIRLKALQDLRRGLVEQKTQFLEALRHDLGKTAEEADLTEWLVLQSELDFAIKKLPQWIRPERKKQPLGLWSGKSYILYQPHGHCLVYAPWNYPLQLAIAPIIGALAAGNEVTLKPSEHAPYCSAFLQQFFSKYLSTLVTVVEGDGQVAASLLEQDWDFVFFTGSPELGKLVMRKCADRWIPFCVELGGSNPCVLLEPFNLDVACRRILWAKLMNAGQTCVSPNHMFVPANQAESLLAKLQQTMKEFAPIDQSSWPQGLGQLIHSRHWQNIAREDQFWQKHASHFYQHGTDNESSLKYAPRLYILDGQSDDLLQHADTNEIFGPLLPIFTYKNADDVFKRYQKQPTHPLAFYIFSQDHAAARPWLEHLRFGGGCLNDCFLHMVGPYLPFGGTRRSGIGRYHGKYSFQTFSHEKSIFENRSFPDLKIRYQPFTAKNINFLRRLL